MGLLQSIVGLFATIDRRPAPVIVSHNELGKYGEQVALAALRRRKYRFLAKNYHIKGGEIDLICLDGNTLCFIEVKARHRAIETHPADAVHDTKQRRIARAAEHYLQSTGYRRIATRFDVVEVLITAGQIPECRFITNAFTA